MYGGAVECKMKHMKRANIYKNSTGSNVFNPDKIEAWSYQWWQYVKKEGKLVIFNDYNYSQSTNQHQSATKDLMKQLKIKVDLIVFSRKGLQSNEWREEIYEYIYKRQFLSEYKLTKKGLRKDTRETLELILDECKDDFKKVAKIKNPLTKKDLKALKADTIASYERTLASNREEAKVMREKRKAMLAKVKDELNSLEPVKNYDKYEQVNSLESL